MVPHLLYTSWSGARPPGTTAAPQSQNIPRCGWLWVPGLQPQPSPEWKKTHHTHTHSKTTLHFHVLKICVERSGDEAASCKLGGYLGATGRGPHPRASRFHQSPLVGRQQVVLHGLDQVVFTRTAVLDQRLLLHPLPTQTGSEKTR